MATIETRTEQPTPFIHLRTTITQQSKGRVAETSVSIDFDPAEGDLQFDGDRFEPIELMGHLQTVLGEVTQQEIRERDRRDNAIDNGEERITERLTHDRISQEEASI